VAQLTGPKPEDPARKNGTTATRFQDQSHAVYNLASKRNSVHRFTQRVPASKRSNPVTDKPRERLRADGRPLCRKESFFIFVAEREGTNGLAKSKMRGEGRRGGTGKKRRRTIRDWTGYKPLSFSTRRPPPPLPSHIISRNGVKNRSERPQINWQVSRFSYHPRRP